VYYTSKVQLNSERSLNIRNLDQGYYDYYTCQASNSMIFRSTFVLLISVVIVFVAFIIIVVVVVVVVVFVVFVVFVADMPTIKPIYWLDT
jgi:ABC-type transport system involved in cytochrome bd biosynthesis fused ATPase/permease subunit